MATNLTQQITNPAPPDLGTPGAVYEERFFAQSFGSLSTFFNKLTSVLSSLFGPRGGKWINNPYGSFQDGTDQIAANTTTAYAITFNTTDYSNGITLSDSSRLNVAQSGIYNIQFSLQLENSTNDTQDVDIWFRKNGTDVDKSNSVYGLPARKSSGDPSHGIATLNFFISLAANDYVQIMWRTSNVGVTIQQYAAGTSPTRPITPSVIATMTFVSNLSTETS